MKLAQLIVIVLFISLNLGAQELNGFRASGLYDEQQMLIEDSPPGTRILINAPLKGFKQGRRVKLILEIQSNRLQEREWKKAMTGITIFSISEPRQGSSGRK
jgi:hypothetical protein